nr:unnamed protein product [Digitaria exilis]
MPKRRRGELDGRRRLYLVLDDWVWGYSIREIDLSSPFAGDERRRRRRLPPPLIQLEAPHGSPWLFAGVGGKILAMHSRMDYGDSVPGGFVSIVDVRTRGVTFGPCHVNLCPPIFFSVADDDELYALEYGLGLVKLSLKPLWPPRLEYENNLHHAGGDDKWAWLTLAAPPFDMMDVRSCALHPDGKTILVSATAPEFNNPFRRNNDGDDGAAAAGGTFGFDTKGEQVWVRHGEWTMPFVGWAHFVHGLNALVGFSDDPDTAGHLCACEVAAVAGGGDRRRPSWKVGKEKMVGEDPNERQIGYTLVYMGGAGEGSESGDEGASPLVTRRRRKME